MNTTGKMSCFMDRFMKLCDYFVKTLSFYIVTVTFLLVVNDFIGILIMSSESIILLEVFRVVSLHMKRGLWSLFVLRGLKLVCFYVRNKWFSKMISNKIVHHSLTSFESKTWHWQKAPLFIDEWMIEWLCFLSMSHWPTK